MSTSQKQARSRKRKAPEPGQTVLVHDPDRNPDEDGAVIIGHRLNAAVAGRSCLLAGIGATSGLASLPGSISPEDMQLWQAACVVDIQPSTAELITVLKVADVLADEDPEPWISNFTDRILQTDWADDSASNEMLGHLLTLPPHLLYRTLASCLASSPLATLYATLPSSLHDVLISCAAAEGTLTVPPEVDSLFFVHLAKADTTGAALDTLHVPTLHTFTEATAALLARAISAHTSLRDLDLQGITLTPHQLRTLTAGLRISPLPSLQAFALAVSLHAGVASDVAELLKTVPSAQSITLSLQALSADAGVGSQRESLRSAVHAAAYPACMPNLLEIELHEDPGSDGNSSLIPHLLTFMRAPVLTSMSVRTNAVDISTGALIASLARLPALRQLTIDADVRETEQRQTPVSMAEASLPALQELMLRGECSWLPIRLTHKLAAAAHQTLTKLDIGSSKELRTWCGCGNSQELQLSVLNLFAEVNQCQQLQHLELRWLGGTYIHPQTEHHAEAIANCVGKLSQLTYLALQPGEISCQCAFGDNFVLHGGLMGPKLQGLTALQQLHLCNGGSELVVEQPDALLRGIRKLKALRVLGLWAVGLQMRKVAELVTKLPVLTRLELVPEMFEGEHREHLDALRARCPELQVEEREFVSMYGMAVSDAEFAEASESESDGEAGQEVEAE